MCQVILSTFAFVLNRAKYIRCPLPTSWILQTHGCRWTTRTILSFPWVLRWPEPKQTPPATLAPTGPGHWKSLELNPRTTEKSETDQFGGQLQGRSRNLQFWFQRITSAAFDPVFLRVEGLLWQLGSTGHGPAPNPMFIGKSSWWMCGQWLNHVKPTLINSQDPSKFKHLLVTFIPSNRNV